MSNSRSVNANATNERNNDHIADDEIDLRKLVTVLWEGKWIIIGITFLFSVGAVFYALSQPNIYRAQALLAPAEQEQSLGGMSGQLGGLASLAGINIGGREGSKTQLSIEILQSRLFISKFIEKYNILPDLMAAESWQSGDNSITYDNELYIKETNKWVRQVEPPAQARPSMQEAYKKFRELLSINEDSESGMVTLAVEHISPIVAHNWVKWLIEDINQTMKERDVEEAQKSTVFLVKQIEETKITDIRTLLYKLVEDQTKTIMFANVRDEYIFKTIDPAVVPEEKSGPKRALICIFGALFGGMLSVVFVFLRHFMKSEDTPRSIQS